MTMPPVGRRKFLTNLAGSAAAVAILPRRAAAQAPAPRPGPARIRFAVIGINHGHINSQVARSCAAAASWSRCTPRSPTCSTRS